MVSRFIRLTLPIWQSPAWNFVRINELVFDAGFGSTDGFFFNASGLQWDGRGDGVFKGWLGMFIPLHATLSFDSKGMTELIH